MSLPPWPSRTRGGGATITSPSHAAAAASPPSPSRSSSSISTSSSRKHPRSQQEQQDQVSRNDDHDEENDEPLAPELTDVAAALSLLVQRFHHTQGPSAHARTPSSSLLRGCPVVLQHQLYTILDDHTAVDVELEDLRRRNFVRLLRLLTLRRDVGVLLTSTYVACVQAALDGYARLVEAEKEQQQEQQQQQQPGKGGAKKEEDNETGKETSSEGGGGGKKKGNKTSTSKRSARDMVFVFSFFLKAIEAFTSLSVTRRQLETLLTDHITTLPPLPPKQQPRTSSNKGTAPHHHYPSTDLIIRVLLHSGFLARRVDAAHEEEAYWFSAPELGRVTASLPHGRKAILAALRRSRYKELSERNLGALELKGTMLSLPFHIADLVGSKEVLAVPTASGVFLKLPPGAAAAAAAATGGGAARGRGRRT